MNRLATIAAYGLMAFGVLAGGCVTEEHRNNVAATRDEERRADFERCRSEGRSDCDAILNAPVDSTASTRSGDTVRERERRAAYDRCVNEGGHDCDDLLKH
jgi:hypothetical protein